jgi:hypothetical protein
VSRREYPGLNPDVCGDQPDYNAVPSLLRRLLGRSASDSGTLCHVDRAHGSGDHLRMPLMLPILILSLSRSRRAPRRARWPASNFSH